MKRTLNNQAWDILNMDEQTTISLVHISDKSSWGAGEIMDKSHYKLLEIKARAEKFLRLFTEWFELYDEVFPSFVRGDKAVIGYLRLCIEKRMKPTEAVEQLKMDFKGISKPKLNRRIIAQLQKWEKEDSSIHTIACYNLIKEFDRWNNFRILPKSIQEPSAFKRRVKNYHKKQIKNLISINPIAFENFRRLYETKSSPYLYFPYFTNQPVMIKVKVNKNCLKILNTLGLYVFKKREDAEEYSTLLFHYVFNNEKQCRDGLEFWPKFRELIKNAANYHDAMKIVQSRKHLELALQKFTLL